MNNSTSINQPVYVVGAGGIGVVMAWCLVKSGVSVTMVEANINKITHANQNGIEILGHGSVTTPVIHFDDWVPDSDSLVLLCTKTYINAQVLDRLPEVVTLLPVQNGFDPLLDAFHHQAEGIVSFVSECETDRAVTRITRKGEFHLGRRSGVDIDGANYLSTLTELLGKANLFPAHLVEDIAPYKYTKLMYNAAISPVASAAGIDNSELLNHPVAKKLFIGLLKENYSILKHAGKPLEKVGPMHPDMVNKILNHTFVINLFALFFKPSLKGTYCSMAPDILTDRTEIEAYNGHLVALAGDFPCPLNRAAIHMIEKIVSNQLTPGIQHLNTMMNNLPAGTLP